MVVLCRGDCYVDRVEDIKKEFRFLFRIKIDGRIYNAFKHGDTNDVLIFVDDRLEYIGKDGGRGTVCSKFLERDGGRIYRINHRLYFNPLRHASSLVGRIGESEGCISIPSVVEASVAHKNDWGLTAALIIGKALGCLVGYETQPRNSLARKLGFDYGCISTDIGKEDVLRSLGCPVYVDAVSGVEYYGQFEFVDNANQLIGIAYSNGVVNAVFSDEMLDQRIVYKCHGLDYVESEGQGTTSEPGRGIQGADLNGANSYAD